MRSAAIWFVALILLSGCQDDSINGKFLPDCPAYAGDSILLANGRYEWDKFTDAIAVDSQGNIIDEFPGHPQSGLYRVDGKRVSFQPDAGQAPPFVHIQPADGRIFLLDDEQLTAWQSTGKTAPCDLVLQQTSEN